MQLRETVRYSWTGVANEQAYQLFDLSPVSTTRVDGPSWRVTGFHYPSTRAVNSGSGLEPGFSPTVLLLNIFTYLLTCW